MNRYPAQSRQPNQQQTTSQTTPLLAPTPSGSRLNSAAPSLHARDPGADPCCGVGGGIKSMTTKFASALGMGKSADPRRAGAAVAMAQAATDQNHAQFGNLSSDMCWDAVKRCGVAARAIDPNLDAQHGLVSPTDHPITSRAAMENLPAGHAVGFFEGNRLAHVMLSVGDGHACGNKNSCVGVGRDIGWESLDLKSLQWNGAGGITAPGTHSRYRTLEVRSRPLGT